MNLKNKLMIPMVIIILIVFYTGCDKEKTEKSDEKSIDDIVKKMYEYANKYEYKKMKKYFTNDSKTKLDVTEMANEYVSKKTRSGSLKEVTIVYKKVEGQSALIRVEKVFNNGEKEKHRIDMIKEDGDWKIVYALEELDYVPKPKNEEVCGIWTGDFESEEYAFIIKKNGENYSITEISIEGDLGSRVRFKKDSKDIFIYKDEYKEYEKPHIFEKTKSSKDYFDGTWKEKDSESTLEFIKDDLVYYCIYKDVDDYYGDYFLIGVYLEDRGILETTYLENEIETKEDFEKAISTEPTIDGDNSIIYNCYKWNYELGGLEIGVSNGYYPEFIKYNEDKHKFEIEEEGSSLEKIE
ncbi:MAG: DUF4878 domain-containing protein [Clostridiales bacterium]